MRFKLPVVNNGPLLRMSFLLLLISTFGLIMVYVLNLAETLETKIQTQITSLGSEKNELTSEYSKLTETYENSLYEYHLTQIEQEKLQTAKTQIEEAYEKLSSSETGQLLDTINSLYEKYNNTVKLIERNKSVSISTTVSDDALNSWGILFLNKEYELLDVEITKTNEKLNLDYNQYLASLPTPTPTSVPAQLVPATGYSYQNLTTSRGSFGVYLVKLPLSQYTVKTVSANTSDCKDNCPVKPLRDYIVENNAYAGMNGTYFCPPDYASCTGKANSYDFALYNSNIGKWLNESNIYALNLGLAGFNGSTPVFLSSSNTYSGQAVTAGMVNFPSLLSAGDIAVNESSLTSFQKDVRGVRGAIGTDGSNVYLALINSATVTDAAHVMKALGATYALNLDGGGSSALYIGGSYRVGPGRLLPNAVVLVPR